MRSAVIFLLAISTFSAVRSVATTPEGFSWVDPQSDKTTIAAVRHALKVSSYTSIRRVGVEGDAAIVMTTFRESGEEADHWSIYNVSLATDKARMLVSGYRVKVLDWIGLKTPELAIAYYDCWGCEAATLFTTIHFTNGKGWRARWPNKRGNADNPQPGAIVSYGDVGEPYDDSDVDQLFAVVNQPDGGFAVGIWLHSRDAKTGKINGDVEKYSIDPATGDERVDKLTGDSALKWELELCSQSNTPAGPNFGQSSKACRRALRSQSLHSAPTK
jgi:hypothetical protein